MGAWLPVPKGVRASVGSAAARAIGSAAADRPWWGSACRRHSSELLERRTRPVPARRGLGRDGRARGQDDGQIRGAPLGIHRIVAVIGGTQRQLPPPGAWTRSMDACSTCCSARRTTSAGCRPARSRAPRSTAACSFSREDAQRQHAEMVSVYEEAGVRVHFLEPDPALPYQVFARDSSINVPAGPDRDPVPPVVAARRVRAGDPLLRAERDPDPPA